MPIPHKGESREDFVARYMSSEEAKKAYPDDEQRLAIAYSKYKQFTSNKEKESRFSFKSILEVKENLNDLIVKGYIATTHFDGQDIILKETLDKWANEINKGIPRINKVSINHEREKHVAGVGIKGTARVDKFNDGYYGLYVETLIDKTKENYDTTKYRIEKGLLDSFSIEYQTSDEVKFNHSGARILGTDTELFGWTLASQPMNEHAIMIKELVISDDEEIVIDDLKDEKQVEIKQPMEDVKMTEEKKQEVTSVFSEKEMADFQAYKELKMKEEFNNAILAALKDPAMSEKLKGIQVKEEPFKNTEKEEPIKKEVSFETKEFIDMLKNPKNYSIERKFNIAGAYAEKEGLIWVNGVDTLAYKKSTEYTAKNGVAPNMQFKSFCTNGTQLEFKSLGITTNQNTDTDYLLSAAELRDVFDPVIYDVLNQSTTTWGLLRKDDFSNKGNNQVQFVIRNGLNSTAGFYSGNSVTLSKSGLIKLQTKFKKAQAGVSVDGDMIAAAKGGMISDVFSTHVKYATEDLLSVINQALFAEVGLESADEVIGFEYITDSAGNTTLYNETRTGVVGLEPTGYTGGAATDTYINGASARISVDNMRKAIENAVNRGANLNNLVFITHPTQERLYKGIYDASQRVMPTSARFGFEGRASLDGVPIFVDKDCNNDDWFLVDLESHRAGIWVPPTLEMLGKRSDADEGYVKTYFAIYNTSPCRMVQIYGNATS